MIAYVIVGGIAYFLFKEYGSKDDQEESSPDPEPTPTPDPGKSKWTDTVSWSGEYVAGDNVVWTLQRGIRFQDGSTEMDSSIYIVIGNANHTAFLRQSTDGGTINLTKEETGGDTDQKNVKVFPSIAEASAKADELAEPSTPSDPTDPQQEPEDDGAPTQPSLPTRPDYGLGGGGSSLFTNGGI